MSNLGMHECGAYCSNTEHAFVVYTKNYVSKHILVQELKDAGFNATRVRLDTKAKIPKERPWSYRGIGGTSWQANYAWLAWMKTEYVAEFSWPW